MIERTTNYIAGGAASSPLWLPSIADVSQAAATALPILGCAWLLLQMIAWFRKKGQ